MNAPLRPPSLLQRVAWLKDQPVRCAVDLTHNGDRIFIEGKTYPMTVQLVRVRWREQRATAAGVAEWLDYEGFETGFVLDDEGGVKRWFIECRLGRREAIKSVTDHDWTVLDFIHHFDIPAVQDIAEVQPEEYAAARERLLCLTKS